MRTDYDTLVDDFGERAGIDNLANAERAAIETLPTFCAYIEPDQAAALWVLFPGALGAAVTERSDYPEDLSVEAFVALVADRQGFGVDDDDALRHCRAIMATIATHGGHDELRQARNQLPAEFARLFETVDIAG
jgi:uncharacterized protein (DUF2267 family)